MIREESWCQSEFSGIRFGDRRLEARLIETAERLSKQPLSSINQACGDWTGTKAAYRMFANEKVTPEEIMAAHQRKTLQRMQGQARILAVQDTSSLNFGERTKTRHQGLGPIGSKEDCSSFGLIMHTTLAIRLDGVSLGILDQQLWARDHAAHGAGSSGRKKIEQKESYKWLKALQETRKKTPAEIELIHVSDRESDIYEYLVAAVEHETSFLVRAWQSRLVKDHQFYPLRAVMESQPVCSELTLDVPARTNGDPARTARIGIRFRAVEIEPPPRRTALRKQSPKLPSIKLYAVWVGEINPPAAVENPLEWMLLTNVPVEDAASAEERVQWYRLRWHIEMFHKVLKSGYKVEACRLESGDRLQKYISLFSVVAWRLYWMTHLSRKEPGLPCTDLLGEAEWKALYCQIHKTRVPPAKPPTLRESVRWIAQLGGFLARKGDGEPGPTVIWRGWQRLSDITQAWSLWQTPRQTCG